MNNTDNMDNCAEYFAFKDDKLYNANIINNVTGDVINDNGDMNILGTITSAYFYSFDKDTETFTIHVTDNNVPGFWLQIPIKIFDLNKWVNSDKVEIYSIKDVKGRVMDKDRNINTDINIDNAHFYSYNKYMKIVNIRIEDSHVPGFWVQLPIELSELYSFIKKYFDNSSNIVGNDGITSPINSYNIYGNSIKCMKCDSLCHVQKNCINI